MTDAAHTPTRSPRPVGRTTHTLTVRVPAWVAQRVAEEAERAGVTRNAYLSILVVGTVSAAPLLYVKLTADDVELIRRESEARGISDNQLVVELIRKLADPEVPR